MQEHKEETQVGHHQVQQKDHTRNDSDITEPEESQKNTDPSPRQTDYTLACWVDKSKVMIIEEFYTALYNNAQSTMRL